ncbi:MAG TPA: biotin-dependent carboxyltransferase family protein [Mycobacteriales bacterium]|nr:biotin-dependent carboxyltransferase family protein [Mycobacteriales bacterium]
MTSVVGTVEVVNPGALTTVQDTGRFGWAHLGVPAAGPADWLSHALANLLVGNDAGAAALEGTLLGPTLRPRVDTTFAVVGGTATVDGEPTPVDASFPVRAGQRVAVRIGPGARAYLAVAGGFRGEPVLGSRAGDTFAGLGPAPLVRNDRLPVAVMPARPRRLRRDLLPPADGRLRVVPGPNDDWFEPDSVTDLLTGPYTVSTSSDRVGVRLSGTPLRRCRPGELATAGMVTGALQVPPDGQPIVLLANHGPTGGYPVVAVVATVDLPRIGQVRPGVAVSFTAVSRERAVRAYAELRAAMATAVV